MAGTALRKRKNWQTATGPSGLAGSAEKNLYQVFEQAFKGTHYEIIKHPTDLKHLYEHVQLSPETLAQIYCPDEAIMEKAQKRGWGITPDFAIRNNDSGKMLFGEIKRQDGWVEGKTPKAGRGNAHERMCKLFTPGLMKEYRRVSGIVDSRILSFWVVLEGDITRDPKRNREIAFWFDSYDKNYFMWRPNMSDQDLIDHFENYLKPFLE